MTSPPTAPPTVGPITERTVGAALDDASTQLTEAGISGARFEARLLMERVLGVDSTFLIARPDRELDTHEWSRWRDFVARRCRREPMAYILGEREFWSLPLKTTVDTLIPRPDSETLIGAALAWVDRQGVDGQGSDSQGSDSQGVDGRGRALDVLDLGTGSGCLLVALLSELPRARGTGLDISDAALDVARANADLTGVGGRARFVRGDWGDGLTGVFDLIVANPPYVAEADFAALQDEVACFEPRRALAGGADGLDCYRAVIPQIGGFLRPSGAAFFEIGAGQGPAVVEMAQYSGLQVAGIESDLAGIDRCVAFVPQGRRFEHRSEEKRVGMCAVPD